MSQPFRAFRSLIALSSIAGFGGASVCRSDDTANTNEASPVSYSVDSIDTRYMQAGLIRILKEDAAQGDQLIDTRAKESNGKAPESEAKPGTMPSRKGMIELTPLGTPNTKVQGIGTGVRPEDVTTGRLPMAQSIPTGETRNGWGLQPKQWVPGGFCHQPLYFEDPMLERHGHVRHSYLQPAVSGLRFFGTAPLLPYLATLRHPLDDVHILGAYRPGTAAPALRYRPHYDPVALRNQFLATAAAAVTVP